MEGRYHYNLSSAIDEWIPFMPEFIVIYFGCYLFWVVNYCIIALQDREGRYRFFTADFYARIVCLLCFTLFPTTNTRPEISGQGIWECAVRFLYAIDAPTNLFPSIHCMASWFCYVGIRKRNDIPGWYKLVSCIIAVSVFISTLALRQHVLLDVVGGILLAEGTYYISCHTNGYQIYMKLCEPLGDSFMKWIKKYGK